MARSPLDRIEIASPCTADWDGMKGDDRVRHCGQCELDVYDLSALTRNEAEALIQAKEGRLCVRLYRRPDGRVITQDCPEGRAVVNQRRSVVMAGLAGAASLLLGGGAGLFASRRLPLATPPAPTRPPMVMGAVAPARPTPAQPALMGEVFLPPQPRREMGQMAVVEEDCEDELGSAEDLDVTPAR